MAAAIAQQQAEARSRLSEACRRWSLSPGPPFVSGAGGITLPVTGPHGLDAVLKIQFPHRECEHEAAALAAWDGDGAVRLLDHAPDLHALLIERCRPGTPLSGGGAVEAVEVLAELVGRLARPVAGGPFTALADEAAMWAVNLPARWRAAGEPFDGALVERAVELFASLPATQGPEPPVLLHQDLHGDNVLAAERERWLAIDPKPLAGELAFAAAPIVRSRELGHDRAAAIDRLDRLCARLSLDRERARWWTFAQTMAWCFGEDGMPLPGHLDVARWMLDA